MKDKPTPSTFLSGLRNKRVLITGASGAIGSAMARLFASFGAQIGIHYNQGDRQAHALRQHVLNQGGKAECFQENLLDAAAGQRLMESFVDRFGRIDILVNNAGAVLGARDFLTLDEESWDMSFALNAKVPFFIARGAFEDMKKKGGGKIINISSISAKYGGSSQTLHYGAAKAALEAVTVGLAREGAPHRILVNAIRAGFIDTPAHKNIQGRSIARRIQKIPLQKAGRPLDVARMALFLASEAGDFITGEILTVSGGD